MPPQDPGRVYYYLDKEGALARRFVQRQRRGRRRSSQELDEIERELVVAFDWDGNNLRLLHAGPRHSDHLGRMALLREYGIEPSNSPVDLGPEIPSEVRFFLQDRIRSMAQRVHAQVVRNWNNVSKEPELVAFLLPEFNDTISLGEWALEIRPQVFSDQTKEPRVGADIGWIVQIRTGTRFRTTKAVWMQAKRTPYDLRSPASLFDLKDFSEQFEKMRACTRASYGLVFTQDSLVVGDDSRLVTLDAILDEVVSCSVGDQDVGVVASTVERHMVTIDLHRRRRSTARQIRGRGLQGRRV